LFTVLAGAKHLLQLLCLKNWAWDALKVVTCRSRILLKCMAVDSIYSKAVPVFPKQRSLGYSGYYHHLSD
jgi:hypothetical protein